MVLISLNDQILEHSLFCDFHVTTNEAEYEAFIAGLKLAQNLHVKKLFVKFDSQLVVSQVIRSY